MGRRCPWGPVVVAAALLLAACGDDGGAGDSTRDAPLAGTGSSGVAQEPSRAATGANAATGAAGGGVPDTDASGVIGPLTPGRDVVYTGSLDVRVGDVAAASRDAQLKVTAAGGYLFSQRSSSAQGAPTAVLVFKVPPNAFLSTIDLLAGLGTEVARNVQADDVTAQVVDLEARLKTARASLDRTRELLARATTVAEIVTVEAELARRETAVEQIEGQLRVVQSRVAAATITLTIGEKLKESKPAPSDDIPSVVDGLRGGGAALVNTLQVAALVLAALLPWTPVLLLAWWVWRRTSRWLRRRHAAARHFGLDMPFVAPRRPMPPPPSRPSPPPPTADDLADPPSDDTPAAEEPDD